MSDRFEASLEPYLAGIFTETLRSVLKADGFQETLRIPEPDVTQFQRDHDVLSLQTGHAHGHRQSVVLESELVDVSRLAAIAAKDTILAVCDELLGSMRWVDRASIRGGIEPILAEMVVSGDR